MRQPDMIEPELLLDGGYGSRPASQHAARLWCRMRSAFEVPLETFALTPPPGPRQRAAAAPPAEPGALLTLMETRP